MACCLPCRGGPYAPANPRASDRTRSRRWYWWKGSASRNALAYWSFLLVRVGPGLESEQHQAARRVALSPCATSRQSENLLQLAWKLDPHSAGPLGSASPQNAGRASTQAGVDFRSAWKLDP